MPTVTPIYNWPVPVSTDLVKDGATAIESLGDAIDSTMATMIPKTIVDAKGDLIAASASDTPARIAVGANNTVLTADSSTATGLKWAAPSAAAPASGSSYYALDESTSSTSYTDLATAQSVTLTTGTKVLVQWSNTSYNTSTTNYTYASMAISGATTLAASDDWAVIKFGDKPSSSTFQRIFTVNAGSNTFTLKFRVTGGSGPWYTRSLSVIDLGS
jgi:hypothetical protein